jgi:hypothetical protein
MPILVITATVTPPSGAADLSRTEPTARLNDYCEALGFYVEQLEQGTFDSIVFVENSNSDISRLKTIAGSSTRHDCIEFISYYGLDYPPSKGRAFGEMQLLDHCMAHSELIRAAAPNEMIWKVTGRYIVRNVKRLLKSSTSASLYCHCRNFPTRWADMYFMGWVKAVYAVTIAGCAERISQSSEREFRKLIDEKARVFKVSKRFRYPPKICGVRGWDSRRYEDQRGKEAVRAILSRIAPWVWV